jgi:hypothetical protein
MNEVYDTYIAGPMAGHDKLNIHKFRAVQNYLRDRHAISSLIPHDIPPHKHLRRCPENFRKNPASDHAECCYARGDLVYMLRDCAAVVVLPGWNASVGTRLELMVAAQCGLPSMFVPRGSMAEILYTNHHQHQPILSIPDEMWYAINDARYQTAQKET